jgi:DNA-directed RNA polymerase subunit beta
MRREIIENIKKNDLVTEQLKKFFATNPLSQIMEEKNAIAETTQKRRITCLGIGGIKNSQTNLTIREIHPSQYGRICPIETSEGKNAGLVLSFVNDYNLNSEGFLNTAFYM